MSDMSEQVGILQQLLGLHAIDQRILNTERELRQYGDELAADEERVFALEAAGEKLDTELQRARAESRATEHAADAKRDTLERIRSRVNQSQNEKQYSASSLEFDLVRQDLRKMEDRAIEKLQVVEELETRKRELEAELEEARATAAPRREEMSGRRSELEDELAIDKDRRENLAIRLDKEALSLYDRIRQGRSEVALAPLTEESVCGHCYTSVTIQQEMQIKSMTRLICCEGCGVILYPESFDGK